MFIPVGYLYKTISLKPDWIDAPIEDVYSISGCVSGNFADYINYWKHNGYWLFDSPEIMQEIANDHGIDLSAMQLCYYEAYPFEYIESTKQWKEIAPEPFVTQVKAPINKQLMGFDVATFWAGNIPECSPLSCNNLAAKIAINSHCLFDTFEEAKQALEQGFFDKGEPGPYRVFAVYRV